MGIDDVGWSSDTPFPISGYDAVNIAPDDQSCRHTHTRHVAYNRNSERLAAVETEDHLGNGAEVALPKSPDPTRNSSAG
jgi:hypothetical protein